jgi:hypothetical protein
MTLGAVSEPTLGPTGPVAKCLAHPLTDFCKFDILPYTVPAHGGSKCNSVKMATQKSSTSFSLRSCMERGRMASFARFLGRPDDTDPLCGLRTEVLFCLASVPNSTTSHTKSRRYFGPVQTQSLKEIRSLTFSPNIYWMNTLNIPRILNSSLPIVTVAISHSVPFIICKSVRLRSYATRNVQIHLS